MFLLANSYRIVAVELPEYSHVHISMLGCCQVEDRRVAAEKALLSMQVKNESLVRQLELQRQNSQQLKVAAAAAAAA